LEKIFALEALSDFYESNNNFALTKFKHLSVAQLNLNLDAHRA